jgi:hypothetical protein
MPARNTSETYAEYTRISVIVPRTAVSVGIPCRRSAGSPNPMR